MDEAIKRTFIAHVEDKPGVLNRVVSLFRRRSYNIMSLSVGSTETPGVSRITFVMAATADAAQRIQANLYKMVNVLQIEDVTHGHAIVRELILIKVKLTGSNRNELLKLCDVFKARVVDVDADTLTMESSGDKETIRGLIEMVQPFGILEMVRTGAVAMGRGSQQAEYAKDMVNRGKAASDPGVLPSLGG